MNYYYRMKMPLDKARICLECDTIHDLVTCPECGSSSFYYVANWIKPKQPPRAVEPEQLVTPVAPARKKRHWVRNTLLAGASVLAAYQFLFKPTRKKPPEE